MVGVLGTLDAPLVARVDDAFATVGDAAAPRRDSSAGPRRAAGRPDLKRHCDRRLRSIST
jgi:hypothetical protein